jgi:hypothetical protein
MAPKDFEDNFVFVHRVYVIKHFHGVAACRKYVYIFQQRIFLPNC